MSRSGNALRVGLTGGVASGKSTVGEALRELGVTVIDADAIGREVVAPGSAGLAQVAAAFGDEVLDASGALDRRRMRSRVFEDAAARARLESILHPLIRRRALEAMRSAQGPYVVLEVPLLVETGFDRIVDRIVVVDVPEAVQLRRLMQRDGETEEQARRVLAAQSPRAERLAAADHILDNSGTPAQLRRQIAALHRRLLDEAQQHE